MTSDLKDCPFCGGEAGITKAVGEWWARCLSCEATTVLSSSEDRAITAWNTRAKADQIMGVFEAMSEPRPEVLDALRAVIRREYGIDQQSGGRLKRIYAATVAATLKGPTHDQ